jgi:hypothetical protein
MVLDWPTLIAALVVGGVYICAGYFAQVPSGHTKSTSA